MSIEHPRRAFDLTISIGGNTWADVVELLRDFAAHVEEHGPECSLVLGGYVSGGYVDIRRDPAMTHDAYCAAIEQWCEAVTEERARKAVTP